MSFISAAASAMPQLPVSWKEFSELLLANQNASKLRPEDRPVTRVFATNMDLLFDNPGNQRNPQYPVTAGHDTPANPVQTNDVGSTHPRDSPHDLKDCSGGIDVWA